MLGHRSEGTMNDDVKTTIRSPKNLMGALACWDLELHCTDKAPENERLCTRAVVLGAAFERAGVTGNTMMLWAMLHRLGEEAKRAF
jgi:hypothetical protein